MAVDRCRNCGDPDHLTRYCKAYGPWFPEPGKQSLDYAAEAERIQNLIAGDILAEHAHSHGGEHASQGEGPSA